MRVFLGIHGENSNRDVNFVFIERYLYGINLKVTLLSNEVGKEY